MNLQGNINLAKLEKVGFATLKGKRCIVIPVEENDVYIKMDEDGKTLKTAAIGVNIWENREGADQWGNTHYVQQALSKDAREKNPDKKVYLGNMKPKEPMQSGNEAMTAQAPEIEPEDDGLPF